MSLLYKHNRNWRRLAPHGQLEPLDAQTVVRSYDFPVPTTGLAGRSLAFLSDIHWRGDTGERLERIVEVINTRQVDWIVFGGDIMRHLVDLPAAFDYFGRMSAARAKIAVLGNRERCHHWCSTEFWRGIYAGTGFRMLINDVLTDMDAGLVIAGLDDLRHGEPDLAILEPLQSPEVTLLTVTHTPDAVAHQNDAPLGNLVLAGHTHGGQFRLPFFGALYTSSAYGRQFDRGWFERADGTKMFVTTGAGETGRALLRRRLFCPAEVAFLNFVSR